MTVANQPKLKSGTDSAISASDMPEGWIETTLDQLLQGLESGSRPKGGVRGITEGIPSIGGEHLNENGGFRFESIKFVPCSFFERMNQGHVQTGDILIVKDGATTGKVSLVRGDFPYDPAVVNEHVFICRPDEGVYSAFLFYFLFSKEGQDRILENFRGSAQGGINKSFAPGTAVPLAPLAEQKRIVAKVEELLARVNVVRKRLAKVKEILKRFRQSVLAAACSGQLTADWRTRHSNEEAAGQLIARIHQERLRQYERLCLAAKKEGQKKPRKPSNLKPQIHHTEFELEIPDSWFWTTLKDIASTKQYAMSSGPFGSGLGNKDYKNSGVPVIRGKNIQNGFFLLKDFVYISEEKATELARSYAEPGDVVVVAVGTSGQAAIVPNNLPRSTLSQNCNKITVDKSLALPEFVLFFLQIEIAKNQLREKTTDTARPFLSLTNLKETLIAVPPLEEQQEIVRRLEALFKLTDQIEKRVVAVGERAERLTQSILAKAFRGELVPTEAELARLEGRHYEPAYALLAKIKAQRKDVKPQRKRGRALQRRNNISVLTS